MQSLSLTTTSYALLGQLALRPWTPYALAAEMRRNLRYFWPRAERGIYAELKRLAARGLATADASLIGRRPRTTYAITVAGRHALEAWLADEPRSVSLEAESVLRVFFGHLGTREQLLAAVDRAAADAQELLAQSGPRIGREYLEDHAPFQEYVHVRAFVFDFLTEFALAVQRWSERTRAEVLTWQDVELSPSKRDHALRRIAFDLRALHGDGDGAPVVTIADAGQD
jgi:PadR family transcriptional regulator AphA